MRLASYSWDSWCACVISVLSRYYSWRVELVFWKDCHHKPTISCCKAILSAHKTQFRQTNDHPWCKLQFCFYWCSCKFLQPIKLTDAIPVRKKMSRTAPGIWDQIVDCTDTLSHYLAPYSRLVVHGMPVLEDHQSIYWLLVCFMKISAEIVKKCWASFVSS